jgi:uncharacterized protein (DUF488 family)
MRQSEPRTVYTIGHSNHTLERFIALLTLHDITALGDVRSQPYSRANPQFNREELKKALKNAGIAYVFLGRELGARSDDPACYVQGRVQYDRIASTEAFQHGLERVLKGMMDYRLALMCAEKEPVECHRAILVARHLVDRGVAVQHVLADGGLERHDVTIERLRRQLSLPESDMFRSSEEVLADAYRIQESRIAYSAAGLDAALPTRSASG